MNFFVGVDCLVLRYGYIFWGGKGEGKSIFILQKRIIPISSNAGSTEHGVPEWGGSCNPQPNTLKSEIKKKHGFCRYGDIKSST